MRRLCASLCFRDLLLWGNDMLPEMLHALFLGMLGGTLMMFAYAAVAGRRARSRKTEDMLAHKDHINVFLVLLVTTVVILELLLVQLPAGEFTWIKPVHLSLVSVALATLPLMRFKYTGLAHPRVHKKLFKVFIIAFIGIAMTGVPLYLRLPL